MIRGSNWHEGRGQFEFYCVHCGFVLLQSCLFYFQVAEIIVWLHKQCIINQCVGVIELKQKLQRFWIVWEFKLSLYYVLLSYFKKIGNQLTLEFSGKSCVRAFHK